MALAQAQWHTAGFSALCVHNAVAGGLMPELAQAAAAIYRPILQSAATATELQALCLAMYEDLLDRVYQTHHAAECSAVVRTAMDAVQLHLEEDISIAVIADKVGYSGYYLSQKFRRETGMTLNTYIRHARIERAKLRLTTTNDTMDVIAARLHFCSRGYFARTFREQVGLPPAVWRRTQPFCCA